MAGIAAPSTSKRFPTFKMAPTWAVQCKRCKKWRVIPMQEDYENIRKNILEVPFTCPMKERVSCNDPPDVEQGNGSLWSLDKPNIPKSPAGFVRKLTLRNNPSKLEVYYETPSGKNLRRPSEIGPFLSHHPEYSHLSPTDFDFKAPRMQKEHH